MNKTLWVSKFNPPDSYEGRKIIYKNGISKENIKLIDNFEDFIKEKISNYTFLVLEFEFDEEHYERLSLRELKEAQFENKSGLDFIEHLSKTKNKIKINYELITENEIAEKLMREKLSVIVENNQTTLSDVDKFFAQHKTHWTTQHVDWAEKAAFAKKMSKKLDEELLKKAEQQIKFDTKINVT